jgi:hypothetical protein
LVIIRAREPDTGGGAFPGMGVGVVTRVWVGVGARAVARSEIGGAGVPLNSPAVSGDGVNWITADASVGFSESVAAGWVFESGIAVATEYPQPTNTSAIVTANKLKGSFACQLTINGAKP